MLISAPLPAILRNRAVFAFRLIEACRSDLWMRSTGVLFIMRVANCLLFGIDFRNHYGVVRGCGKLTSFHLRSLGQSVDTLFRLQQYSELGDAQALLVR